MNDTTIATVGAVQIPAEQPNPQFQMPPESDADANLPSHNDSQPNESSEEKPTQKDLVLTVGKQAEYWHSTDGEPFTTIRQGGIMHLPVKSNEFREWLCHQAYRQFKITPGNHVLDDVIRILSAQGKYDGEKFQTHVRVAGDWKTVYLHLADQAGTIIKIDALGASDASDAPIKFLTKKGMRALPRPQIPPTIEEARRTITVDLKGLFNLKSESDWCLFIVALLSALLPTGPYVIVILQGEQGSSKSTTCRIVRRLVDPSEAPLRSAPRSEQELLIATHNAWMVCFDNLSKMPQDLSDAFCRTTTGGGNSYRKLYTDDQEVILNAQRPIWINAISIPVLRGDLIDRSICLNCAAIPPERRKSEQEFWAGFSEVEAVLLGALLRLLNEALKQLPGVQLSKSPRMADFARFGVAVERALELPDGTFLDAYESNRQGATAQILDNHFANLVIRQKSYMPIRRSAKDLWDTLREQAGPLHELTPRWFPTNSQQLSAELRRLTPFLREAGIEVEFGKSGQRYIELSSLEVREDASNASPAPNSTKSSDLQVDASAPECVHED